MDQCFEQLLTTHKEELPAWRRFKKANKQTSPNRYAQQILALEIKLRRLKTKITQYEAELKVLRTQQAKASLLWAEAEPTCEPALVPDWCWLRKKKHILVPISWNYNGKPEIPHWVFEFPLANLKTPTVKVAFRLRKVNGVPVHVETIEDFRRNGITLGDGRRAWFSRATTLECELHKVLKAHQIPEGPWRGVRTVEMPFLCVSWPDRKEI